MRWRLILSVLIGMASLRGFLPSPARAQERPDGAQQSGDPDQGSTESIPCLLAMTRVAQFHCILGRLSLDTSRYNKCSRSISFDPEPGMESVEVTAIRGIPSLHYRLETPQQCAVIDVTDAAFVRIESTLITPGRTEKFLVTQPAVGPVTADLKVMNAKGDVVSQDSMTGASLIHLRASHPKRFQSHLIPLLNRILDQPFPTCEPDALLLTLHSQFENQVHMHVEVVRYVDQLRSPQKQLRVDAEKQLLAMGLPVLSLIRSLNATDFDLEQKRRLRAICDRLEPRKSDTPDQLARWLVTDIAYWNLRSQELSPSDRNRADAALTRVTGKAMSERIQVADAVTSY